MSLVNRRLKASETSLSCPVMTYFMTARRVRHVRNSERFSALFFPPSPAAEPPSTAIIGDLDPPFAEFRLVGIQLAVAHKQRPFVET